MFFRPGDYETIYLREGVQDKIDAKFSEVIWTPPDPSFAVNLKGITVLSPPTFISKKGLTLEFSSRVVYQMEAVK